MPKPDGTEVRGRRARGAILGAGVLLLLGSTMSAVPGALQGEAAYAPVDLVLEAPIARWDEALPLGNGLTGGLLWGEGNVLRLSLDRGDLWDERLPEMLQREDWTYATMKRLQAAGDQATMVEMFDNPYNAIPYPTKLPGGRLEIELAPPAEAKGFRLDLAKAEGHCDLGSGSARVFFSAATPVAMLRIDAEVAGLRLVRPAGLDRLGYGPAETGEEGELVWLVQEAADGLTYAVVVGSREVDGATEMAVAITSTGDHSDPLVLGKRRVGKALQRGYVTLLEDHRSWWGGFWSTSRVRVPEPAIQAHYDLVKYFHGAASRRGAPPMPLQGVWTADEGGLPPWKGDFHNDLNTQMTYLAYHAAGLVESGESFLEHNWKLLPEYKAFAKRFYGVDGAVIPGVMTLNGKPTGGWGQYSLSPTNGAWVAQSFYLHWKHTMDKRFLWGRAFPFCVAIAEGLVGLLEEGEDGMLRLPLSTSPEIHNNSMQAWLTPNSNYDLSLMRWLFGALAEMEAELKIPAEERQEERRWSELLARLEPLDVSEESGGLTFAKGIPYFESHRHLSHSMAIHPLGTLHVEGSDEDRAVIDATIEELLEHGTAQWTGYSFSWTACLLARCGRADLALRFLRDYERAFILRNGFHVNGDQIGAGLSNFRYRPFTLEGNFLAMEAVHEMLLQSWGGVVRVFPATSDEWMNASFEDLAAQGGFRVSARRRDGRTVWVRVEATVPGTLRLRRPFGGGAVEWNRDDLEEEGDDLVVRLDTGDVLEGGMRRR